MESVYVKLALTVRVAFLKTFAMAARYPKKPRYGYGEEDIEGELQSDKLHRLARKNRDRSRSAHRGTHSEDMGDVDEPMDAGGPQAGMQNMGGGQMNGGGNQALPIENELKFGQKITPCHKTFKRSYLVNIKNGVDNLHLNYTPENPGVSPELVNWNEGWYIIPWGILAAYLTPQDYFELMTLSRKWRIKAARFRLEGIIPFQVDLTGAANTTTTTFNNRVNLHTYEDDGELLPKIGALATEIAHSEFFSLPWGSGDACLLKSPRFQFYNAKRPQDYRYSIDNEFANAKPQKFFSLYDTGCVKSVYPGQKWECEWKNDISQWFGRSTNDNMDNAYQTSFDLEIAEACAPAYTGGVKGTGRTASQMPAPTGDLSFFGATRRSNYLDTGLPISTNGPKYALVRVEPYPNLGAGGGFVNLYAQAHLHYELDVEHWPMERPRTYVPFSRLPVVPQGTPLVFEQTVVRDMNAGITDNIIQRVLGPNNENYIHS